MTRVSPRTWVLIGFGISMISVAINLVVLSNINERIKATDDELSKLTASLGNQATELYWADMKADLFVILNHISHIATKEEKRQTAADAIQLLQGYLKRNYAAVHDVPEIEMLKADNEEYSFILEGATRFLEAEKKRREGDIAGADRLKKEAEDIQKAGVQPQTELGKRLRELEAQADPEKLAGANTNDVFLELVPSMKSLNEDFISNYQAKEARISELRTKKADLASWAAIATYTAVGLQFFGLMFLVTRDLTSHTREQGEAKA